MEEFLNQLSQYLYLTKEITEKTGTSINVGEKFKVKFTLTNTAPPAVTVVDRKIRFKDPYITVVRTPYARPYFEGYDDLYSMGSEFPETELNPGESTSEEFEFVAIADIIGIADFFLQEEIATAYVDAHLDADEYFKIMRSFSVRTEIYPAMTGLSVARQNIRLKRK
jgi:hypothetical protein